MLMPGFDYLEPRDIQEALEFMSRSKGKAKLLSGGTDLIVNLKKGLLSPEALISMNRIEALTRIEMVEGEINIGSCCTVAEIAENEMINDRLPALGEGARRLGSPLIRNLATIGGNIITARPAADLPPPLMAHGAELILKSISRERVLPLDGFFKGPGETILEPDEILTGIRIRQPPEHCSAAYLKLGIRETLEISLVNVAALMVLEKEDGPIKAARIVLGSVAPVPFICASAERVLLGEKPAPGLFVRAGEEAALNSRPIDDFRASAEYRKEMVKVLTRRALEIAYNRIKATKTGGPHEKNHPSQSQRSGA